MDEEQQYQIPNTTGFPVIDPGSFAQQWQSRQANRDQQMLAVEQRIRTGQHNMTPNGIAQFNSLFRQRFGRDIGQTGGNRDLNRNTEPASIGEMLRAGTGAAINAAAVGLPGLIGQEGYAEAFDMDRAGTGAAQMVGTIAGSLAPTGLVGMGIKAAGLGIKGTAAALGLYGAAEGGALGAFQPLNKGNQDPIISQEGALAGAVAGGVLGAAAPWAASKVSKKAAKYFDDPKGKKTVLDENPALRQVVDTEFSNTRSRTFFKKKSGDGATEWIPSDPDVAFPAGSVVDLETGALGPAFGAVRPISATAADLGKTSYASTFLRESAGLAEGGVGAQASKLYNKLGNSFEYVDGTAKSTLVRLQNTVSNASVADFRLKELRQVLDINPDAVIKANDGTEVLVRDVVQGLQAKLTNYEKAIRKMVPTLDEKYTQKVVKAVTRGGGDEESWLKALDFRDKNAIKLATDADPEALSAFKKTVAELGGTADKASVDAVAESLDAFRTQYHTIRRGPEYALDVLRSSLNKTTGFTGAARTQTMRALERAVKNETLSPDKLNKITRRINLTRDPGLAREQAEALTAWVEKYGKRRKGLDYNIDELLNNPPFSLKGTSTPSAPTPAASVGDDLADAVTDTAIDPDAQFARDLAEFGEENRESVIAGIKSVHPDWTPPSA